MGNCQLDEATLLQMIERHLPGGPIDPSNLKTALPKLAKDRQAAEALKQIARELSTSHRLFLRDARDMSTIPDGSVHLVVTSPPYWTLKAYRDTEGQLGHVADYEQFIEEL